MLRIMRTAIVGALLVCASGPATADVRNPGKIQLSRDSNQAAQAGQPYAATVLFTSPLDGALEDVAIGGVGWEAVTIDLPADVNVLAGETIRIPFTASVADAAEKLEIRIVVGGAVVQRAFDLSPERIAARSQPHSSTWVEDLDPRPANDDGAGGGAERGCDDQLIRVRGRIEYVRPDGQVIGADTIRFQIWDEDTIDSELMHDGLTDEQGYFDVTLCWDDCDVTGCDDPDIYLKYRPDTGVALVRDDEDDIFVFSTLDTMIFEDYTGGDVNFGAQQPTDPSRRPVLHIFNSMVRAHRYVAENSGYITPHVDVTWRPGNGAWYSNSIGEINIGVDEHWNEGTQVHEWGHHLLYQWTAPVAPSYCNGYCDDNNNTNCGPGEPCVGGGGHCIWCAETLTDAWNEGFPDWLGSVVMRNWQARYGGPAPTAINDGRYTLETAQNCCDGTAHNALTTEGFVGALLRDIDDPPQDAGETTCPQDALGLGGAEILAVVRAYGPISVTAFINGFRNEYPQYQHDFRSTAEAVAPAYVTGWSAPPIQLQGTNGCGSYRPGETITLYVQANASRYSTCMRWQRDGVDLSDGGRISGATTETLTITNATGADAGRYALSIRSCDGPAGTPCDGTQSTTSPPIGVRIFSPGAGYRVTGWGRDAYGNLGRGALNPPDYFDVNPADVVNLTNVVDVSAGYWNAVALLADGTVWSWGAYYLGDGTSNNSATPVQVHNLSNIVAVAAGGNETCMALDADGRVWTWGSSWSGQIGDGTWESRLTPVQIGLECVADISISSYHAAAVTSDGTLWAWGYNGYGELGLGVSGAAVNTPQPITTLTNVVEVECGNGHTLARCADGTVWASGRNTEGQLGDGTFTNRSTFAPVLGLADAISISAGFFHSLAVRSDQTPWAWGSNGWGELGLGAAGSSVPNPTRTQNPPTVRALDGGYNNSLFVDPDGVIWTCGTWYVGSLGRPGFDVAPLTVDTRVGAAIKASMGANFALNIAPGARIIAPVTDQLVAGCATAQLAVAAVGEPPVNYAWRRRLPDGSTELLADTGRYSGTTTSTLTIAQTDISDSGTYDALVWNATNLVTSSLATLATPPLLNGFDTPADADWFGNERGAWAITDGAYAAAAPAIYANSAYSSFELPQADFLVELDLVNASQLNFDTNGGIYLRSTSTPAYTYPRGVVLAFGEAFPWGGGDVYWHRNYGSGYLGAENPAHSVYSAGQTLHLRIEVRGNTYTAWANDSPTPTTTLVTPDFPAGRIGLLDGVADGTAFDNLFIQTLPDCDPNSGLTPVSIVARPLSQAAPAGAPVVLSVAAIGSGPFDYQWLRDGQCIAGAAGPSYSFVASSATEGRYECTVSNACGAVGSYPAIVTVEGGPAGDLNGDGHVSIEDLALLLSSFGTCAGDPGFLPAADIDGDDCVGLVDLATLLSNFGA